MQVVLLLKGHPGSGKSSLARHLARQLRWPVIDKDDAKDVLMTQPGCPEERHANALAYSIMLQFAQTQLALGLSVVIDCPLASLELYERAAKISAQAGARVLVVECRCEDAGVWRRRLEARAGQEAGTERAHKPQTWAEVQALLKRYAGQDRWLERAGPGVASLVVDTSSATTAQAGAAVLAYMQGAGLLEARALSAEDALFLDSG